MMHWNKEESKLVDKDETQRLSDFIIMRYLQYKAVVSVIRNMGQTFIINNYSVKHHSCKSPLVFGEHKLEFSILHHYYILALGTFRCLHR